MSFGNIRWILPLLDISRDFQKDYKDDIILAFVDNKLRELFKTVKKDCTIKFVTTSDDAGHKLICGNDPGNA